MIRRAKKGKHAFGSLSFECIDKTKLKVNQIIPTATHYVGVKIEITTPSECSCF